MAESADAASATPDLRPSGFGLSGKLLVLTTLFVMIAEVLIYVPSIANFRITWLKDRLAAAHMAALVREAIPETTGPIPESLAREILAGVGAKAVVLKIDQTRRLLAMSEPLPSVEHTYDLRDVSAFRAIVNAFSTLFCRKNDLMRVVGPAPMGGEFVEIVMEEAPLRRAMLEFSGNILVLSLIISGITAMLVYASRRT
jgi:hypothetical protein